MKSCLVVDDSKIIRTVARRILEEFDFSVNEAENGKVALESCSGEIPDAILLDWNMPQMDGIEFLKELRKLPRGESPIVIFCTTMGDMTHIHEALKCGANEYIIKPFDSEIVKSKLQQTGLIE